MFGIVNRSENWRIAQAFINGDGLMLASKIAKKVLSNSGYSTGLSVEYELFWKGYRDYCDSHHDKLNTDSIKNRAFSFYNKNFNNLRSKIDEYNDLYSPKLRLKNDFSYVVKADTLSQFWNNLYNTEIDIVIKVGGYVLIGEVKHTQTFDADSNLVLVHQLVRQYVMASILIEELSESGKEKLTLVPFVIADNDALKKGQVKLLEHLGWLNIKNVIPWSSIGAYCKKSLK